MTDEIRLQIVLANLPTGAGFSGLTAARLHGLDLPAPRRPEVAVPAELEIADRIQATVRRLQLWPGDIVWARGFPVTSPLRTCFDLAGWLPLVDAVAALDMALHARLVALEPLHAFVQGRRGMPGVARARRVLEHVEPKSESPMESRLRMALILGGQPRPEAQVELFDSTGAFVARVDLYYPEARLAVEYDGENHRDRLTSDDRRQNLLQAIGVRLLRFTYPDLTERPDAVVAQVAAALAQTARVSAIER